MEKSCKTCIHWCICKSWQSENGVCAMHEFAPPCKIGDKVYGIERDFYNLVDEMTVTEVGINGLFASMESVPTAYKRNSYLPYAAFGDEWYMSKEEAFKEREREEGRR